MDEASRLIDELQHRLTELDHKVLVYRRDMASQFQKFSSGLLANVTPDVSTAVTSAIAESLAASSLAPDASLDASLQSLDLDALSPTSSTILAAKDPVTTLKNLEVPFPPVVADPVLAKPVLDVEVQRDPHARENEFLGVFTQGYLPLLDSTDRNERKIIAATLSSDGAAKTTMDLNFPVGTKLALSTSYSPPKRRNSGTGIEDSSSDRESMSIRRSALRRSLSASKVNSPRRVRFEFAGEEFLTTSSPSAAEASTAMPIPILPLVGEAEINVDVDLDVDADISHIAVKIDEDVAGDPELQQVEDVEDELAPRRISSSQALRLLSRGPIEDDGTQWEAVRAPADGSASVAVCDAGYLDSEENTFFSLASKKAHVSLDGEQPQTVTNRGEQADKEREENKRSMDAEQAAIEAAAEAAEEKDILSEMTPLQPQMHSQRGSTHIQLQNLLSSSTPAAAQLGQNPILNPKPTRAQLAEKRGNDIMKATSDDDLDDGFFDFEDNNGIVLSTARPPSPALSDSSSSSSSAASPTREVPISLSAYATSPALPIITSPRAPIPFGAAIGSPEMEEVTTGRPSPSSTSGPKSSESPSHIPAVDLADGNSHDNENSIGDRSGSGNGGINPQPMQTQSSSLRRETFHPFNTPIVSPAILAQAMKLGDLNSFVGSVSGNTGLDESDERTFWGRVGSARGRGGGGIGDEFVGAVSEPRSFSERLALEEWMEGREGRR
jgi:hypothetical protein